MAVRVKEAEIIPFNRRQRRIIKGGKMTVEEVAQLVRRAPHVNVTVDFIMERAMRQLPRSVILKHAEPYYRDMAARHNAIVKRHNSRFPKMDIQKSLSVLKHSRDVESLREMAYFAECNGGDVIAAARQAKIYVFDTKIDAFVRIVDRLMADGERSIRLAGLRALTQVGKTLCIVYTRLMLEALGGYAPFIVNPAANDVHSATSKTNERVQDALGAMVLTGGDGSAIQARLSSAPSVFKRADQKLFNALDAALEDDQIPMVFLDEADWGSAEGGVLKKKLFDPYADQGVIFVLVSATPEEFLGVCDFVEDLFPEPGYAGYTSVATHKIPLCDFTTMAKITRIKGLAKYTGPRDVEDDTGPLIDLFARFTVGINSPKHGLNGKPMNGGEGMFYRAENNDIARAIIDAIESDKRLAGEITIIRAFESCFFGDITDVESLVEAKKEAGKFYILIATGRGRRGTVLPKKCTVAIDPTFVPSTHEAGVQGTPGRMTGYGRVTTEYSAFLLMTDKSIENIKKWANDPSINLINDLQRAHWLNKPNEGKLANEAFISLNHPRLVGIARQITARLLPFLEPIYDKTGKLRRTQFGHYDNPKLQKKPYALLGATDKGKRRRWYFDPIQVLGGMDAIEIIRAVASEQYGSDLKFLMPGVKLPKVLADGTPYHACLPSHPDGIGFVWTNTGNTNREGHDAKSNGGNRRNRPRAFTHDNPEDLLINFMFNMDMELVSISLPLEQEAMNYDGKPPTGETLEIAAGSRSAYKRWQSAATQKAVIAFEATKKKPKLYRRRRAS